MEKMRRFTMAEVTGFHKHVGCELEEAGFNDLRRLIENAWNEAGTRSCPVAQSMFLCRSSPKGMKHSRSELYEYLLRTIDVSIEEGQASQTNNP